MAADIPIYMRVEVWVIAAAVFFLLFIILFIILIYLSRKTHAIIEFKGLMKGLPIGLFFQDNRYLEWKVVEPDAGIIIDKNFGAYIINERATYVDKLTKNIILPFDASFGTSVNIHAAKLADDLQYVVKDEEAMKLLRNAIATGTIDENESIKALKTTVQIGALKTMMTALIPHNINAKIEKVIASRLKNYGNPNVVQVALLFAAVLGAIILGVIIIKSVFPGN